MSSITITENDLTSGGGASSNLDVVFVPGFVLTNPNEDNWETDLDGNILTADFPGKGVPTLCTTLSEFKRYFGKEPAIIRGDNNDYFPDKSYIYAKEVLQSGLPVMYEAINNITDTHTLSVSDMVSALTKVYEPEQSGYGNLYDMGEYSFKYLTSGGYPSLDVATESATADWLLLSDTFETGNVTSNFNTYVLSTKDIKNDGETTVDFECYQKLEDKEIWLCSVQPDVEFIGTLKDSTYTIKRVDGAAEYDIVGFALKEGKEIDVTPTTHKISISITPSSSVSNGISTITLTYSAGYYTQSITVGPNQTDNIIAESMRKLARTRTDCVALIDHPDKEDMLVTGSGSYHEKLTKFGEGLGSEYCAAFTPWINISYDSDYTDGKISMPPSLAYLSALSNSIKTNASWLAVAGAARGQVPVLHSTQPFNINGKITNAIAESVYQKRGGVSINGITNIKPFGNRIWGNRTLKDNSATGEDNLTATSFLNIRNMVSDVKKVVYNACKKYTFEQNNDVLWVNFKAAVEPTLNQMKTGAGLSGYKFIKETTTEKAKLVATIKLYPLYAVEDFEIKVEMLDDEVTVS